MTTIRHRQYLFLIIAETQEESEWISMIYIHYEKNQYLLTVG